MKGLLVLGAILAGSISSADQSDWWPKDRDVDKDFLTFVDQLMQIGLPDPRGGAFSKVVVKEQDLANSHSIEVVAYGWVKPGSSKIAAINGLEYEIFKFLEPADTWQFINSSRRYFDHQGENHFRLQERSMTFYAMLLVSGKVDQITGNQFYKRDLAKDFLDMVRYRCLASTKVGKFDDALHSWRILRDLVKLSKDQKIFETSAEWPVIESLESVDRLGREINRKKQRSEKRSAEALNGLDQAIDNLEDARIQYQPYAFRKWQEYQAVIDFGESSIPRLIEAYENEATLSCVYYRPMGELPIGLEPVSHSAWQMILTLWPQAVYLGAYNSKPSPDVLRSKWDKVKGLTSHERSIELLTDPSLTPDTYGYIFTNLQGSIGFQPSMLNQTLGTNLTALEWLRRRAHQALGAAEQGTRQEMSQILAAIGMIRRYNFAAECPDLDFLKACNDRILNALESNQYFNKRYPGNEVKACIIALYDRQKLGDFTTGRDITRINEVLAKITGLDKDDASLLSLDFLEPGLRKLLMNLETNLTDGASGSLQNSIELIMNLMNSRCIEKPFVRQSLSRLLSLKAELFKAQYQVQETRTHISLTSHQTYGFNVYFSVPISDRTMMIRSDLSTGDVVALMLQQMRGCPFFTPSGSSEERERQMTEISNWLLNENVKWREMPAFVDIDRNWTNSPWNQLQKP